MYHPCGVLDFMQATRWWHSKEVLHLDIKPANTCLSDSGKVVLLDAGHSAKFGDIDSNFHIAATPGFEADELRHWQAGEVTTACDVFSIGKTILSEVSVLFVGHTKRASIL